MNMSKFFVKPADVEHLINSVKKGEIFSMHFERVAPKCHKCNKSNKAWKGMEFCPICGEKLSLERETLAQRGVENPANKNDKPNGNGESAEQAQERGRLKFYDMNAVDHKTGIKGGYRQCHIDSIKRLTIRKNEYYVIH